MYVRHYVLIVSVIHSETTRDCTKRHESKALVNDLQASLKAWT